LVDMIPLGCFYQCSSLSSVIFEPGSQLRSIGLQAFACCVALQSILIPRSVQTLDSFCFLGCHLLSTVTFESGCEVEVIGHSVFGSCSGLQSLCIPSSVKSLQICRFGCSLSTLTFQSPSRLESLELDIPRDFSGEQIEIPSSTIEVVFWIDSVHKSPIVVHFDRDSRIHSFNRRVPGRTPGTGHLFVHFSEHTLKYFREENNFQTQSRFHSFVFGRAG
jgi:hypothetical protein